MQTGWPLRIKRASDCSAAICGLIVLSPLLMTASLLVWLSVGRPILFRQKRPGFRGRLFHVIKFRTMSKLRNESGALSSDASRLTRIGRLLRSTSIDEIPQLWNVLRGEMSLVGPRPLLMEYLDRYTPSQARRHLVLPGITGWAQVNGRNSIGWEEKFALDVWYVDHWSIWLDLRILWMTAAKVLLKDGISQNGHATMPEFQGK